MRQDLHNNIYCSRGLSPVNETGTSALVSEICDTANFAVNEFIILTGSLADSNATFTVLVEEGAASNLSDNSAVADADLLGTESGASFVFSDDNKVSKIGYTGSKRYIRVTITPAANSADAYIGGVWVQSGARKQPFTTQLV